MSQPCPSYEQPASGLRTFRYVDEVGKPFFCKQVSSIRGLWGEGVQRIKRLAAS
jgi:hypothetical protein